MKEGQEIMEAGPADDSAFSRRNYGLIADIPVRLSVEVGSTALKLSELMELAEGSVVELDRQSHELLDIMANGTLIAKGEVVTVNGSEPAGMNASSATDAAMPNTEAIAVTMSACNATPAKIVAELAPMLVGYAECHVALASVIGECVCRTTTAGPSARAPSRRRRP